VEQWIRTRSQAVASIADRTALQHLSGSRDVIGHVTIWYQAISFWWSFGTESFSRSFRNIAC